ncbi:hypothetical protein DRO59_02145 [Candidatus Bathyarchaeota archaeon]|nr:MAG: hypothetical protein DRO59_02145 [Candidatus Bathyarchaeota archaeon]
MQEDLIRYGWPKSKISVVWNGVAPERYNPDNCKPEDVEAIRAKYYIKTRRENASFPRETHMGEGYQKSCAGDAHGFEGLSKRETCDFGQG